MWLETTGETICVVHCSKNLKTQLKRATKIVLKFEIYSRNGGNNDDQSLSRIPETSSDFTYVPAQFLFPRILRRVDLATCRWKKKQKKERKQFSRGDLEKWNS